jgi:hypothetical protein
MAEQEETYENGFEASNRLSATLKRLTLKVDGIYNFIRSFEADYSVN